MAYRRQEYYQVPLSNNNASAAPWPSVTNRAVQNGTTNSVTGNLFIPQTPELFSHDADGNLANDGRWAYTWDGENRLITLAAPTTAPSGSCKSLTFAYDHQGRRISKVASNWTGSAWSKISEQRFLYDGWNLIADLDANNSLLHSYSWGLDLSGSLQRAGGVGGLLAMTVATGTNVGAYFCSYDGNGNSAVLVNPADGTVAGRYEYGPFGEAIRTSGPAAKENPLRYSTKYQDDETDLLYYGYRYYNAGTARWLSRDPLAEVGGQNLFGFGLNDPINKLDINGLTVIDWVIDKVGQAAADLTAWLITDKTTITREHDVSCPSGSSRYLVGETRQLNWRKGALSGGVGLQTVIDLHLESPPYFESVERYYACCSSCGFLSSNTMGWQNRIYNPAETVLSTTSYNTPMWPDAWVTVQKIDVVKLSSRTRQCTTGVPPNSSYNVSQVCTTHLGITHCSN